jgi:hypothetical protein
MAKNKTLMWVGIGLGVALVGFIGYTYMKKKKQKDEEKYGSGGSTGEGGTAYAGSGENVVGGQTTGSALLNIASGLDWNEILNIGGGKNKDGSSATTISNLPDSVPFTNTQQGNAFRGWVNDNYPAYAQQIDLDRTGKYNNSYITKAYMKYGAIYEQQT